MSRKYCIAALLVIMTLSSVLITVFMPFEDILSGAPVYKDDYAMHYAQCIAVKRFLQNYGAWWAYDPHFLAGYPRGVIHPDNMLWVLFYAALSPVVGSGFAFKLYMLLFFMLYPLSLFGAMRNFNFSRREGVTAAFVAIVFFHRSVSIDLCFWGMLTYVMMCFFSLYVLSLFYRLFEQFTWKRYAGATLCGALVWMIHVLAPIHLAVPIIALYLSRARTLRPVQHAAVLMVPVVILALNSFWIIPLVTFISYKTTRPENYAFALQITDVLEPLKVFMLQQRSTHHNIPALNNTFVESLLLVFGVWGAYRWYRNRQALCVAFSAGICVIFLIAYYGSHLAVFSQLQPERFTIPLGLLLLIPASCTLTAVVGFLFSGRQVTDTVFVLAAAFLLLYQPVIKPFGVFYKYGVYRLDSSFPPQLEELLGFVEKHTDRRGRILLEDSESGPYGPEAFYGAHFPALFPEYVDREYLCGPRPLYPIKHSFASFTRGELFEKDIVDYSFDEVMEYMNLYNVSWVICWYDKSRELFDRFPGYFLRIGEIDKFVLYSVQRKPSFFIKGSGRLESGYNRIELHDIVPENGEIIIAYHWMEKLACKPTASIEQVFIGRDPVGFIKIVNPPEELVVYNAY